jgi:hypothetical protein
LKEEGGDEHKEGEDDGGEIAGSRIRELAGENLDSVLEIHPRYVESECIAGKKSDVFEEIAPWNKVITQERDQRGTGSQLRTAVTQ